MNFPPIVAVVGPTATGKSDLAIQAAHRFGGEIISCDSMQVYRGLDIGTAKVLPSEQGGIPHHLIDVRDPGENFSAGTFRRMAVEILEKLGRRSQPAYLVGGTGLYYRTLTAGMVPAPPGDPKLRASLKARMEARGTDRMYEILMRLDPLYAGSIKRGDSLRIVRALEVRMLTGKPLGGMIQESPFGKKPLANVLLIGLTAPRQLTCITASTTSVRAFTQVPSVFV